MVGGSPGERVNLAHAVPAWIANRLGPEKVMLEAAEPDVFAWCIKNYGPKVNLSVDRSQIVRPEYLRAGIWGAKSLCGRVLTYQG